MLFLYPPQSPPAMPRPVRVSDSEPSHPTDCSGGGEGVFRRLRSTRTPARHTTGQTIGPKTEPNSNERELSKHITIVF